MTASASVLGAAQPRAETDSLLLERLASVLPEGSKFGIYHLSTPPTRTEALYSAPPNERPDKTFRENHFLAVSADVGDPPKPTLVLGLEIFVFSTAFCTTLFVSKADSTGYLQLLGLPRTAPSPVREITTAFVEFLVRHRRRHGVPTVVNLFARAQAQYLFPGSVENKGKHVLDDRGLVKWWCRVLNPLVEGDDDAGDAPPVNVKGYLVVPGLDAYETRAFLPRPSSHATHTTAATRWTLGHPLETISHYTSERAWVPPRCLIPRYPDDPKSRFRDELDEEAISWRKDTGAWKSVKSLDQFWEMMAFRQECSSGRLTGFLWIVFDAKQGRGGRSSSPDEAPSQGVRATTKSAEEKGIPKKSRKKKQKKKKKLTGPIIPRQPRAKTRARSRLENLPVSTAYYYWPPQGRGERIVDESDYKRIVELLLHLDFSTLVKAAASTRRWVSEVGVGGSWGREVVGTRKLSVAAATSGRSGDTGAAGPAVTNLSGLIKRKRPAPSAEAEGQGTACQPGLDRSTAGAAATSTAPVNVLGAGLVRKKPKPS
ncbi:hypothetical protein VTK73DRAFT_8514 [Phialemonium thermophilum]|uniref:histone acetyltransferase n=1 Tax=Phialemonium thermophilum TaxID=223376 RepID=A0ABR3W8D2_9PEZI